MSSRNYRPPTHFSDCMLINEYLDAVTDLQAKFLGVTICPENVVAAIERCLDELERCDRGMDPNYMLGDWTSHDSSPY